ncbi:hypothetical protein DAPPUDRAFT_118030 [Daphnia pulex]|uniref:Uncharacterized protein n=1 Tax=Daphnia pulex TaxID=6669 RepID=E9HUH7_DAPPU|nr:hypothetical protein DAPPUDRAFT_118030 [Daphnia pulex]|eukprot:EFX64607.1 hypothetical protein DAPPUDRAFT_118030 [Daphnia pulex]
MAKDCGRGRQEETNVRSVPNFKQLVLVTSCCEKKGIQWLKGPLVSSGKCSSKVVEQHAKDQQMLVNEGTTDLSTVGDFVLNEQKTFYEVPPLFAAILVRKYPHFRVEKIAKKSDCLIWPTGVHLEEHLDVVEAKGQMESLKKMVPTRWNTSRYIDHDSDGSDSSESPPFSHIGVTRCTNSAKQDDEEEETKAKKKKKTKNEMQTKTKQTRDDSQQVVTEFNNKILLASNGNGSQPGYQSRGYFRSKRSWKAALDAATSHFNFQLPLETHETFCELETNLDKNPVLTPKLKAVLSHVGSNKQRLGDGTPDT